jgi:epoxyqueuosine reductase
MPPSPSELSRFAKEKAASLGFALCGITGALPRRQREFYNWWADQGFGAGMSYLKTQKHRRKHISALLPGARSVVVCAMRFPGGPPSAPADLGERAYGKVARYALHEDYHGKILPLLEQLALALDGAAGNKTKSSLAYVDTGALSERAFAAEAGVAWIGKNSLALHPEEGSWFWLGEVLTREELAHDAPIADHCGKCRRCVDACPTGAIFDGVRAVDSRKCLSYWNIEHRGPIPSEIQKSMGSWLLGCDICQEVCPWNAHSLKHGRAGIGEPPVEYIPADDLLTLSREDFTARYKGRAVARAKLEGLQRNARIVKKNFSAGKG